ncbi:MAG: thiamine-phosphate kinase [Thermanaeromonas sp.]|uniref:thiamine-phosphate kinase n=1 Tax=Thermanaeromonas sp. TaxID=2003697 RepID=UPI00243A48BB|nr:thiamine-phosphate kinase [Thermanaeromonas sp.]MCG0277316.1 thiamine-phosphate kinase [Thermanaeromonas sp.]
MYIKELGEFGLIERIQEGCLVDPKRVVKGIGDDAAVLPYHPGYFLLVSTDMLIEGVHFTCDTATPWEIGYKAAAVNVSDIAAMGGVPEEIVVSIGLPAQLEVKFVDELYRGIKECCRTFGINIVGGDTVASPRAIVINITILGKVETEKILYRCTARPGDLILVTGDLGGSAAGLDLLLNPRPLDAGLTTELKKRHLRPQPRVREVRVALQDPGLTAADDISDGLATEIREVAKASNVGAVIYAEKIPLSPGLEEAAKVYGKSPLEYALFGGEDFELLWTCRPEAAERISREVEKICNTPVTIIGEILPREEGLNLVYEGRKIPLPEGGYNHFKL